jgi:hypothetical protein
VLPRDLKNLPVFQFQPGQPWNQARQGHEDNSLTQFAILALWAAQEGHGIPAQRSLAMAEARFRHSQMADGTWGYVIGSNQRTDSMTCAGLLGLAVGRGVRMDNEAKKKQPADPAKPAKAEDDSVAADPAINRALVALGKGIGRRALPPRKLPPVPNLPGSPVSIEPGVILRASAWGDLYYLWSVERVAVVYDLRTIGGKDWYLWGAEILVDHQQNDGSWSDSFPGIVDTSFALLFLKRANVVQSLTKRLQALGSARDPGAGDRPEGGRRMGGSVAEVKTGGGRQAGVIKQRALLAPRPPVLNGQPPGKS